ncbi:hypothetical protein UPYG_G00301280 [Umbra pygmaea]|uniref:Histamine N-methyltransferase n=1 Tax=Umbra pygmaea TaxID=75934 RepID=A0ABD0WAP3_UMBPY
MEDKERYLKCFRLFLERSTEHKSMKDFIHGNLPDTLARIGKGKTHLNVMGVGSGAGEIDLEILSELHLKRPAVTVDYQVVEPNDKQIQLFQESVSQKPNLDYIKFNWNKMTAAEFEKHWKKNYTKKMDFIHMIQVLYYMKDFAATVSFYQSLLDQDGKLFIILLTGESGWSKLKKNFKTQISTGDSQGMTSSDLKTYLDSMGLSYHSYEQPSQFDITECFTEGDPRGELLLDFVTQVLDFSHTAPAELKAAVLEYLRHPDCSQEIEGRVLFNSNMDMLVVDAPK